MKDAAPIPVANPTVGAGNGPLVSSEAPGGALPGGDVAVQAVRVAGQASVEPFHLPDGRHLAPAARPPGRTAEKRFFTASSREVANPDLLPPDGLHAARCDLGVLATAFRPGCTPGAWSGKDRWAATLAVHRTFAEDRSTWTWRPRPQPVHRLRTRS